MLAIWYGDFIFCRKHSISPDSNHPLPRLLTLLWSFLKGASRWWSLGQLFLSSFAAHHSLCPWRLFLPPPPQPNGQLDMEAGRASWASASDWQATLKKGPQLCEKPGEWNVETALEQRNGKCVEFHVQCYWFLMQILNTNSFRDMYVA